MLMEADDNASDICAKAQPNQRSLMWTDGRSIYVELPTRENVPPCIITYRYSEGGLSKALALLGKHADVAGTPALSKPARRQKDYVGKPSATCPAESILRKKELSNDTESILDQVHSDGWWIMQNIQI